MPRQILKSGKSLLKRINAWSISRLLQWETCPAAYKFRHIDKLPDPPSYAAERGEIIHKRGEQYLLGNVRGVPDEFKKFSKDMKTLKSLSAVPEIDLAVTKTWKGTTWNDWDNVWCRGRGDAVVPPNEDNVVVVIDYKTGKKKDTHTDQAELMALLTFSKYAKVKKAVAELWYLDSGELQRLEVNKREVGSERTRWEARVKPMLKEQRFKATPSEEACRWCNFSKAKGGPCLAG